MVMNSYTSELKAEDLKFETTWLNSLKSWGRGWGVYLSGYVPLCLIPTSEK